MTWQYPLYIIMNSFTNTVVAHKPIMQLFRVNVPASGSMNSHNDVCNDFNFLTMCKIKKTKIFSFGQN